MLVVVPRDRPITLPINSAALVPKAPPEPERPKLTSTPVALKELKRALDTLPVADYDYDKWRDIVFAINSVDDGPDGLALAQEWSARSPKHKAEFLDSQIWPYIKERPEGKGITVRTIFAEAFKHGYQEDVLDDFDVVPDDPGDESRHSPNKFRRVRVAELLNKPAPTWIVRNVIPDAEIGVIYGQSGAGKSFVMLDIAAALDRGVEWRGLKTRKSRVVIVAAEGVQGFRNRVAAYQEYYDVILDIEVIPAAPNILHDGDMQALSASLKSAPVSIIILDTLAQVTAGADENSGKDMGKALAQCRKLHELTGALVILVHHAGKDIARGQRGWSGLRAACDFELEVTRTGTTRVLEVSKLKDGSGEGVKYPFRLHSVNLGVDADGEQVTSCVCLASDAPTARQEPKGEYVVVVWQAIQELLDASMDLSAEPVLQVSDILDAAIQRLPEDRKVRSDGREYDARRARVTKGLSGLQVQQFIKIDGANVTLAKNYSR